MDDRTEFNRLYWHSRRGMLEIDVMLMPFTQNHYQSLSENDQEAYRRLLARVVLRVRQASGDITVASSEQ